MPRLETSFLGAITMRILAEMPQADAGWLIQALIAWILEDKLPDDDDIPESCFGAWVAIREESKTIHDAKKERTTVRSEAGKKGGEAKASNAKQALANQSKPKQTLASRAPVKMKMEMENIFTEEPADSGAPARTHATAAGGQRTAVDIPSRKSSADSAPSFDGDDPDRWEVWARTVNDPVDAALSATGEGADKRPVYGKLLRDLGDKDLFREAVILFAAERRAGDPMRNLAAVLVKKLKQEIADERAAAGETVRNPGAALTAQLNEAVTAMEVCAG